jgi:hypothetical protein
MATKPKKPETVHPIYLKSRKLLEVHEKARKEFLRLIGERTDTRLAYIRMRETEVDYLKCLGNDYHPFKDYN